MDMIDRAGKVVAVPDHQVQQAYQSGKLAFIKGSTIPIVTPEGSVRRVRSADAAQAFASESQIATREQEHKAYLEEKHGGIGGSLAALGEGAARGLTFGLSDAIATGIGGDDVRRHLAEVKEAHPILATGGEVVGSLAPMLIPGAQGAAGANLARAGAEGLSLARGAEAAGLAARGVEAAGAAARAPGMLARGLETVGVIPRAVGRLGAATERGIAGLVGSGAENWAGRAAQKGLARGAGAAVEGAAFGVGNEISEAALGNHELTAEKLFAGAAHGALMGGAVGGGLGALGEVASTAGKSLLRKAAPKLEGLADEQAWRALNPIKKFANEAERAGGTKAIGRTIREEGVLKIGDSIEQIAPKIEAAKAKWIGKLDTMTDALDAAGGRFGTVGEMAAKMRASAADLVSMPNANRAAIRQTKGVVDDFIRAHGGEEASITFRQARDFRVGLDKQIKYATDPRAPLTAATDAMQGLRAAYETHFIERGELAAQEIGGSFAKEYTQAKKVAQQLIIADKAAASGLAADRANRAISPTDYLTGAAGVVGGFAHGGPLGAAVGALGGVAHHVIRERGNATLAVVLDRATVLAGVQRATAKLDADIASSVGRFLKRPEATPLPALKKRIRTFSGHDEEEEMHPRAKFAQRAETVSQLSQQVATLERYVAAQTVDLERHAPKTAAAYAKTATRAITFLESKLPPQPPATPFDPKPIRSVSDAQVHEFHRYYDTVKDPKSVLRDMERNKLTPQQVEALQIVSPELYKQIRTEVLTQAQGGSMNFAQRMTAGVLFGVTTDPSLSPGSIQSAQQTFAGKQPGAAGGPNAPHGHLKAPDLASGADKISKGNAS